LDSDQPVTERRLKNWSTAEEVPAVTDVTVEDVDLSVSMICSYTRRCGMGSKGDVKETLTAYLRELHLPTFRECFEELARRAVQETASYEQYLLELAERECQARWAKRTERLLRDSRLPLEKDLASSTWRLPAKAVKCGRCLEGSFVDRRENLLFGKTGTGKTHLHRRSLRNWSVPDGRSSRPCALLVQELAGGQGT
jgi:hypothetical protein